MEALSKRATTSRLQQSTSAASAQPSPPRVMSNASCALLSLPPELRIRIYEHVLLPTSDLASLRTCRFINTEAQSTLYQRRLSFLSQAALFSWIDQSSTRNLRRVRCLRLHLTDVDLSPLLDRSLHYAGRGLWRLYQSELERLDYALSELPNIAELTVRFPRDSGSIFLRSLVSSFVTLLRDRLPCLQHLSFEDDTGTVKPLLEQSGNQGRLALGQNATFMSIAEAIKPRTSVEEQAMAKAQSIVEGDLVLLSEGEIPDTQQSIVSRALRFEPNLRKVANGRVVRVWRSPRKMMRLGSKVM